MALEEDALTDWIVSYLEADSMLMSMLNADIQTEAIEDQAASPFVRIDRLDGEDLRVVGLFRIWVNTTYHIRACLHWRGTGVPDRSEVNAIGERLDDLLHGHEVVTATHSIHAFREEPEPTPTVFDQGHLWLQSGGIYRLRAAAL